MTPALTASWHVNFEFICLNPNFIKDFTTGTQPNAAWLWKFPAYVHFSSDMHKPYYSLTRRIAR